MLPDAGALRQQIERGFEAPLPGASTPLAPAEPAPLRAAQGLELDVREFRFAGNTLLDDDRLQAEVRGFAGRRLTFAELQQAAQAVAQRYREAGWIVRAYLPEQDVTQGIVTIQVVEALFGGVRVADPLPARIGVDTLGAYVSTQQPVGAPLSAVALDRALLLADDLSGVTVSGALEPGPGDGQTSLALDVRDKPPISGELVLDNTGARSTGAERALLSARWASPMRLGDQLRTDLLHTRGTDYVRLGYSLPLGTDGWRLNVSASTFDYRLIGEDFAALRGSGSSSSVETELSYPLVRSRQRNLYFTTGLDNKRYRNEANGSVQSRYSVGSLSLGLAGNQFDDVGGGGASSVSAVLARSQNRQGELDPGENPTVAGGATRLRYALSRQQTLAPQLSLFATLSGQHAEKDLDSSERFYLGGPNGVRAYPVNEASGSRGQLVNLELRWRAVPDVGLTGFYDWGRVRSDRTAPDAELKGYGVGADWTPRPGVTLKAIVAWRDGHNPNATASGKDQDGSLRRTRAWLTASIAF